MKKLLLLIVLALVFIGAGLVITQRSHPKTVKTHEVSLKSIGNNNWQISCHYTRSDGKTSDKYIATLNTGDIDYGKLYDQAVSKCQ